jgi:hypothetical protein
MGPPRRPGAAPRSARGPSADRAGGGLPVEEVPRRPVHVDHARVEGELHGHANVEQPRLVLYSKCFVLSVWFKVLLCSI